MSTKNVTLDQSCACLVIDLQDIENRAHSLGLHVTGHALNRAKNALGWEIAGDVERAGKASRDEA